MKKAIDNSDAEIIVIDNNSSDGSCEMMKEVFPDIKLICNEENVGFSKANNQAVREASGEYVCILNPDTAVPHNIFKDCFDFIKKVDNLGILGVRLIDGTGNFLPESKRNIPTPKASALKLLGLAKGKNKYYTTNVSETQDAPVPVLPGAFMLIKKEVYEELGGFDEDYFMYGEDIDLCYKAMKAGYENYYLGSVSMLHYKGESTKRDKAYYDRFYGAMRIFYNKHFHSNKILKSLVNASVGVIKGFKSATSGKQSPYSRPEKVVLITDNFHLIERITTKLDLPVETASKRILDDYELKDTLFVFDEAYITYNQILMVMDRLKNRNNAFRIRPSACNFLIGSDHSDEKGSVIVF